MSQSSKNGLTLMELLITVTILLIIAAVATPLLSASLDAHRSGIARSRLYQEGLILIARMTKNVRNTTFLQIPNNYSPTRNMLAVSNLVNEDSDFYFGDPLFPRADEDFGDKFMSSGPGILGVDDNGDGSIDNNDLKSDDEDSVFDEETLDGLDNDSDGNIDEDLSADANKDGAPGIKGMDDDGNGVVDISAAPNPLGDDDEDGQNDEEYVTFFLYTHDSGTNTLREIVPSPTNGINSPTSSVVLSTHVTAFSATYYPPDAANHPRISIALTLTGDDGKSIQFFEYAYPRNLLQNTGKRVK
mgnify:CR=1 FL=1